MTSSLVGSEMCIRDSLCAVPQSLALGANAKTRVATSARSVLCSLWPVSYTHLTLPTICSV
eukprot:6171529-Prorocentrum_lima.AAC.1